MTDAGQRVLTPRATTVLRRSVFWVVALVFALVIALASFALYGDQSQGEPLGPDNPAPAGAMAVVEVLRDQGVDVVEVHSLDEARAAASGDAALLLHDPGALLDESRLADAAALSDRLLLLDPGSLQLNTLMPGVDTWGRLDESYQSTCDSEPTGRAGTVVGEAAEFVIDEGALPAGATLENCLATADDRGVLVTLDDGARRTTAVGTTGALSNDGVDAAGNAALALGLLGERDRLVWYTPGTGDIDDPAASLGELTPDWVTPLIVLLTLVTAAAAFHYGRRLGPLAVENLPVVVRAGETMLGRARLYERSGARLRALDALRFGAVTRMAAACGLGTAADVDEVAATVSALTGRPLADVRRLLVEAEPATDRELVELSDRLLELEDAAAAASRP